MDNLLAAITILIQTQQGLTDALNIGENANTNTNIAQLVPNNNNNTPKISIRIPNYKGEPQENILKKLRQTESVQDYRIQFRNIIGQIEDMNEIDKVTYFIEGLKHET
ncbi:31604_t:CDS:2 [Racocetra persica]|uniref:31604_t:CDS:1 n=1 Tax=Racocetra persica TaxID=160502 RepID=A0ACA9RVP7_9GLOM|nr:31604_t:CDS:2 [Racocetra persica]